MIRKKLGLLPFIFQLRWVTINVKEKLIGGVMKIGEERFDEKKYYLKGKQS